MKSLIETAVIEIKQLADVEPQQASKKFELINDVRREVVYTSVDRGHARVMKGNR